MVEEAHGDGGGEPAAAGRRGVSVLLVVSDGSGDPERVGELAEAAAAGGAWGFLIREPGRAGRQLLESSRRAARLRSDLRVLVSDRVDVALAAGLYGVQLGERGLPVDRVRAWVGERLRLGRSVHDVAGARAAARAGADWLVFGHVYETPSKLGLEPAGTAGLERVAGLTELPVLAIGGVRVSRVPAIMQAGARGAAVIGAVAGAPDRRRAVAELVRAVDDWRGC